MKVTVELTDEQAELWVRNWYDAKEPPWESSDYEKVGTIIAKAIVAARPRETDRPCSECGSIRSTAKPLKVGDKVVKRRTSFGFVIALGRATNYSVAIVEHEAGGTTLLTSNDKTWEMSTGSPIVWPSDG